MNITFWAPGPNMGTTAAMIAIASAVSLKYRKSCLLMQIGPVEKDLEDIMSSEIKEEDPKAFGRDFGLDALFRQFKARRLCGEDIYNSSVEIVGGLSILPATGSSFPAGITDENIFNSVFGRIFQAARERFDTVMIDIGNCGDDTGIRIMRNSDIVAVICSQDKKCIERVMDNIRKMDISEDRIFFIFARYLGASRYSVSNLKHFCAAMGIGNTGTVPCSAAFMDAVTDKRPVRFLKCFEGPEEDADDPYFYSDVSKCAGKMLEAGKRNERRR